MSHLTDAEVELFVTGRLEPAVYRRAVRHLVGGCVQCQTRFLESTELKALLDQEVEPKLFDEAAYDEAIDRAIAAALSEMPRWEEEKERRDRLVADARACPGGILGVPWEDEGLQGWAFAEALLVASREERFRDRRHMRLLAFAASVAARNLDPRLYGRAAISDLCARASAELANAYRLNDEFESAEQTLTRAEGFLADGTGDPLILARLLEVEVSLRSDQKRLEEALELLGVLHQLYVHLGETHLAGQTLISQGINTAIDDRPKEAVPFFRGGLDLIDPERDPQLEAIGRYGLLNALELSGEHREAGRLLLESGLREAFADDPLNLARLRWLEGKIHAGLGKLWRAEQVLTEVRSGFLERGQGYEAALVGLDLAAVWLRRDNHAAVRGLAEEILETFAALGIQREGIKAVRYLREACRREMATPALVQRVSGFLRRLEWQPQLRFVP